MPADRLKAGFSIRVKDVPGTCQRREQTALVRGHRRLGPALVGVRGAGRDVMGTLKSSLALPVI